MTSMASKWMTAVASAAISVMMGGAAFGAPAGGASAAEGRPPALQSLDPLGRADGGDDPTIKVLRKVASTAGTKATESKGQARRVLRPGS